MILNLTDVCHHLSNTAKDILDLPEFQKVSQTHIQKFRGCYSDYHISRYFKQQRKLSATFRTQQAMQAS